MKVVVQQIESQLYLSRDGRWASAEEELEMFEDGMKAIAFCIARSIRGVRLVSRGVETGKEVYLYPFGADPQREAEARERRGFRRDREKLKEEIKVLKGQVALVEAARSKGKSGARREG